MTLKIVVSGTDTGIGKTVFAAGLTALLDGLYWKPVQAGLGDETDSETVARLSGLPASRILPEAWRLTTPASPHLAAALDGVVIDPDALVLPQTDRPLVVEGAGGLLVPLTRATLFIDVFACWGAPVVLCARTALGTINHTLLSIEALRRRAIPILGVVFIGDEREDTQRMIAELARVRVLGCLPRLNPLTPEALRSAMRDSFDATLFDEVLS
ncbi:dethiobiotin synthase [Microvirga sp. VF16]|uniref:dethiobiotin synthase n=1 Tax=Microvirga sp. VF16 TaxID=2807101 RepID=UPI00193D60F9|nr:dethiobiotin synthase [Microvirga sp. VF16]QRM32867.1 ATP-dependent dethiobiotin synthetase BioD [Microvirga sp. VF16]